MRLMAQSPCPRQCGLGRCEGAGTNSDTWEVFVSMWAPWPLSGQGAGVEEEGRCLLSGTKRTAGMLLSG